MGPTSRIPTRQRRNQIGAVITAEIVWLLTEARGRKSDATGSESQEYLLPTPSDSTDLHTCEKKISAPRASQSRVYMGISGKLSSTPQARLGMLSAEPLALHNIPGFGGVKQAGCVRTSLDYCVAALHQNFVGLDQRSLVLPGWGSFRVPLK
jgi:hypothetical protein